MNYPSYCYNVRNSIMKTFLGKLFCRDEKFLALRLSGSSHNGPRNGIEFFNLGNFY